MSVHQTTVNIADLTIDPRVQRREGTDERRVNAMAADLNPSALGTLDVSKRDNGSHVILDGAHRVAAAKQAGYKARLRANIHTGLSLEQEAELFVLLNTFKQPSAVSRFLARVVMKEEIAVEIMEVVKAHGWKIGLSNSDGYISAVDALERVYRDCAGTVAVGAHREAVDWVLDILTAAWEHDRTSANAAHLLGLAQLHGRFGSAVDGARLVREMRQTRPDNVLGRAKNLYQFQGGTVPSALAKVLVGMHNKKLRTNLLPEWVWVR